MVIVIGWMALECMGRTDRLSAMLVGEKSRKGIISYLEIV
jgi:hypothetical protein